MAKKMVTVRIQRYNPDVDEKPYFQDYQVELTSDKTILDTLEEIKTEQDGSVTYRRSCRHSICGSCAMNVNRRNMLVCTKPLRDEIDRSGRITIRPLPYLPVIRDLVVDRSIFWDQYQRVKPWLIPPDDVPEKEFRMTPEEVAALEQAETCIMCGACYSSCAIPATKKDYIGPHALLKAFLRVLDPRDTIPTERLEIIGTADGAYRCHKILNCIDACPKNLDPAKAIAVLSNLALKRKDLEAARTKRQATLKEPPR